MTAQKSILPRFAATTAIAFAVAQAVYAQNPLRHEVRIDSQPIGAALKELASQTGLQVLVLSQDAGDKRAPAISGLLTNEEALKKLLLDSGLSYQKIDENTVAIVAPSASAQSPERSLYLAQVDNLDEAGRKSQPEDQKDLEEVVVEAKRRASTATKFELDVIATPQSIKAVTTDVIDFASVKDFTDLTKVDASTSTNGTTNGWQTLAFRGFSANSYNGFMIDGVPLLAGAPIDLVIFDRIEILKGPSSTIYGQNSVGGMINAVTKKALPDFRGYVDATVGSWGFRRAEGDVGGPLTQDGKLSFRGVAAYEKDGSFVDYIKNRSQVLHGSLNYDFDDRTSAAVSAGYQERRFTPDLGRPISTDMTVPDVPATRFFGPTWVKSDMKLWTAQAQLSHEVVKDWKLRINTQYERSTRLGSNTNAFGMIAPNGDLVDLAGNPTSILGNYDRILNDQWAYEASLTGNFDLFGRSHTLYLAVDHHRSNYDDKNVSDAQLGFQNIFNPDYAALEPARLTMSEMGQFGSDFKDTVDVWGGSLQLLLHPVNRVSILAGMRLDKSKVRNQVFDGETAGDDMVRIGAATYDNRLETSEFLPQVGMTFELRPALNLYANYGESFVPQTGTTYLGDPIPPERGRQYEVGIKGNFLNDRITVTSALFDLLRSHIAAVDADHVPFAIDTGRQRSKGAELDIFGNVLPGWSVYGSFAYIDAKIVKTDNLADVGARPFNVPEYAMSLYTSYQIPSGVLAGFGLGGGIVSKHDRVWGMPRIPWLGRQFNPGDYTVANLRLFYERERATVDLKVNNVTDKRYYITDSPGLRCCIYPGRPREVQVSVRYKF